MTFRVARWIVGPPAAGKTTQARLELGPLDLVELIAKPKWTIARGGRVVAAGHYTGATFDGADMVPYSGARAALEYWRDNLAHNAELTIFDGDRFSHRAAVEFVRRFVDRVEVVYCGATDDVLAERRAARCWSPSLAWLKGRETKAKRFLGLFHQHKCPLHSTMWSACKFKGGPT
jgi:hypothetical protein